MNIILQRFFIWLNNVELSILATTVEFYLGMTGHGQLHHIQTCFVCMCIQDSQLSSQIFIVISLYHREPLHFKNDVPMTEIWQAINMQIYICKTINKTNLQHDDYVILRCHHIMKNILGKEVYFEWHILMVYYDMIYVCIYLNKVVYVCEIFPISSKKTFNNWCLMNGHDKKNYKPLWLSITSIEM